MRAGGEGATGKLDPCPGGPAHTRPHGSLWETLPATLLTADHTPWACEFPSGSTGIDAARGAGGAGVKIRHGLFCGPSGEMAHTGCQGGGLAGRRGIGGEGWATGEA